MKQKINELTSKEFRDLPYIELINIINQSIPNEIMDLSNKIGYPVFTRLAWVF